MGPLGANFNEISTKIQNLLILENASEKNPLQNGGHLVDLLALINCGIVTPYDNLYLGQHCLRLTTPSNCLNQYWFIHYSDVIMGTLASQITGVSVIYSTVRSGADKKYQSTASPVNSPHKGPVARKMCGSVAFNFAASAQIPKVSLNMRS